VKVPDKVVAELASRAKDAPDVPAFRREVLDAYRTLVPFDTAVFSEPIRHESTTTIDVDSNALQIIQHCERNFHRYEPDLRGPLELARKVGGFVDHEVYSSRDRRELRLYREIVGPQRVRSSVVLTPCWRGSTVGIIRLERHGGTRFSQGDLELATTLLPVIQLAMVALRAIEGSARCEHLPRLSIREAEIAGHVARGLTTSQIALILGTSPLTVRNQIGRIFDKTRVASRAELAAWVARERLLLES
jgi:DNA-binding CsgD family transcriptional regulator